MKRSDTSCPLCNDIETPLILQLWDWLAHGYGADVLKSMHAMEEAVGTVKWWSGETWYDHHRRKFETTGADEELIRMQRHVGL